MQKPKLTDIDQQIASAKSEMRDQHALVLTSGAHGRKIDFARLLSNSLRQFRMIEIFRMDALKDAEREVFVRDTQNVFATRDRQGTPSRAAPEDA